MNETKDVRKIILAFHILFAMFGFCLTILIGSIIHSEISRLFWTAIISGIIFSIAGRYLAFVWMGLQFKKNKMQNDASQKPKDDKVPAKGNIVNIVQEAEKPKS